jgi:hypothetical protein
MSAFGGPNIIDDGLVLYLDAGNRKSYPGSGTTWFDKSGRGNNGTLTNGPTFDTGSLGSVVFDGTNDYVSINRSTSIDFAGQKNITVCQFIKFNSFINNTTSLMWEDIVGGNGNEPILIRYGTFSSEIKNAAFELEFSSAPSSVLLSTTILQINTIYQVCGTYDGIKMKIYINGVLENEINETRVIKTPLSPNARWIIGSGELNSGRWVDGNIYNTQIYNRALSAQEALQNYNATKGRFGL